MKKYKRMLEFFPIAVVTLLLTGMQPFVQKDVQCYLGQAESTITRDLALAIEREGIQFVSDEIGKIVEIQVREPQYIVDGITVGDSIERIYEIYPSEWLQVFEHHVWLGKGQLTQFGIVTEETLFILDTNQCIQEIRTGYTTDMMSMPLPTSNEIAGEMLTGTWESDKNRILAFTDGRLQDNVLDNIWDEQYYTVLSPNELLITRKKDEQHEKVRLRFLVDEKRMQLFVIDERGLPISKSIETFLKKN